MDNNLDGGSRRPTVIDLFSGAGGLSLGFEMSGFDVLSALEYDPVHAATHLYNFPMTDVLCKDVRTVTADDLLSSARRGWKLHYGEASWSGTVDVLIGGPSCQGFSTIGRRNEDDERNELVLEFVRLVEELRPKAICMENVPGFLHDRHTPLREEAKRRLIAAGYALSGLDRTVNAEHFGVPQKRRRVLVLGRLGSESPKTPLPTHVTPRTVADAFAGLSTFEGLPLGSDGESVFLSLAQSAQLERVSSDYLREAGIRSTRPLDHGHPRNVDVRRISGFRPTQHSREIATRFGSTTPGTKEPISRYFRLDADRPALTLRAGTGRERGSFSAARPIHPDAPRVITVREAARLHSFPDWFRFHTTNWHAHRQIGNAVPPLLGAAAARAIMASLGLTATKSDLAAHEPSDESLLALSPSSAATRFAIESDQVPVRKRTTVLQ